MAKIDRPTCPLSMLSMSSTEGGASQINNTPWSRPSNCMVSQRPFLVRRTPVRMLWFARLGEGAEGAAAAER
jgi:hypothetical protein